jgi:hypothetical protein
MVIIINGVRKCGICIPGRAVQHCSRRQEFKYNRRLHGLISGLLLYGSIPSEGCGITFAQGCTVGAIVKSAD